MQCHKHTKGLIHREAWKKEAGGDPVTTWKCQEWNSRFFRIVCEASLALLKQTAHHLFRGEELDGGGVSCRWWLWESWWWLREGENKVFVCILLLLWTCLPVLTALAVSISPALNMFLTEKWPLSWISAVDHHWRADAATMECLELLFPRLLFASSVWAWKMLCCR